MYNIFCSKCKDADPNHKGFARTGHLTRHIKAKHSGDPPQFPCQWIVIGENGEGISCTFVGKQKSNLKAHVDSVQ